MGHFRRKRLSRYDLAHRAGARQIRRPGWGQWVGTAGRLEACSSEIEIRWAALNRSCQDRASQTRLARLIDRLGSTDRGTYESALAELELATLLMRAGFAVRFLPESQSRTADLECFLGSDRLNVEVTALIGSRKRRSAGSGSPRRLCLEDEEEEPVGVELMNRLMARIAQKARQLADYCSPVLLAITVPRSDPRAEKLRKNPREVLDLKRLAGAVTVLLPLLPQVSAVLLSFWEIDPTPAKSGVRLANVQVAERSARQSAYPRVRMLIANPAASSPLSHRHAEALTGLL